MTSLSSLKLGISEGFLLDSVYQNTPPDDYPDTRLASVREVTFIFTRIQRWTAVIDDKIDALMTAI